MKTFLVTGCTGLVGHGICYYLLSKGYKIIGTARQKLTSNHPNLTIVSLDLAKKESIQKLDEVMPEVDIFVHNAAIVPKDKALDLEQNVELFNVNFIATYRILKVMEKHPKKFIYISSIRSTRAYSNTLEEEVPFLNRDEYSTSKLSSEVLCRQFYNQGKLRPAILRISAPYGYLLFGNAVIPRFIKQALSSRDILLWGSGLREQIFTFVDDIGHACELVSETDNDGVFNITSDETITMKALTKAIIKAFPESKSKIIFTRRYDPEEGPKKSYSIQKAKDKLKYRPNFDIARGLAKIADSIKNPLQVQIFRRAY